MIYQVITKVNQVQPFTKAFKEPLTWKSIKSDIYYSTSITGYCILDTSFPKRRLASWTVYYCASLLF